MTTTLGTLTGDHDDTIPDGQVQVLAHCPDPDCGCKNYDNTAKIVETKQEDKQDVTVCKSSLITNSSLCTFPNDQFRVMLTPDQNQTTATS